jgi:hypothetical protein
MRLHWRMTTSSRANRVSLAAREVDQARAAIEDSSYLGRSVQDVPIRRSERLIA